MAEARDVYRKIIEDLETARSKMKKLEANRAFAVDEKRRDENLLLSIAKELIVEGAEQLPPQFLEISGKIRRAVADADGKEAAHIEAVRLHRDTRMEYTTCLVQYDQAAEAGRQTMVAKPEYVAAAAGVIAGKDEKAKHDNLAKQLENDLAMINTMAKESLLFRMVSESRVGEEGYQPGHFVVAAWDRIAAGLKETKWYRRADAQRISMEARIGDLSARQNETNEALAAHKAVIQQLDTEMQHQIRPALDEVARLKEKLMAAKSADSNAARAAHEARVRAESMKKPSNDATFRAIQGLAELLRANPPTADSKRAHMAVRSLADGKTKGTRVTAAVRSLALMSPAIDGYTAEINETKKLVVTLENASRGMRYKGLNTSSKDMESADDYMSARGGEDLVGLGSSVLAISMLDDLMDGSANMGSTLGTSFDSFGSSSGFDL